MKKTHVIRLCAAQCLAALVLGLAAAKAQEHSDSESADNPPPPITLDRAIALALAQNPRMRAAAAAMDAAAGHERQAAALPNPELEVELEDVAMSSSENRFASSVYSLRIGQTFELGGKRAARRQTAAVRRQLSSHEQAALQADLVAAVKGRFVDLLTAQKRLQTLGETHDLAKKIRDAVAEHVRSGKIAPVALTKAEVEVAGAQIEQQKAERQLAAAKTSLGALWAASPDECRNVTITGDLEQLPTAPDRLSVHHQLQGTPEWRRDELAQTLAEAEIKVERAAQVPDLTVTAGVSHERESGEELMQVALSLPLPLFDRNRDAIAAARAEARHIREEVRGERIARSAELEHTWHMCRAAVDEAHALRDVMLPGARQAVASTQEAYSSGKIGYLDLLDAQKTLAETTLRYIDALAEAHRSLVAIERLTSPDTTLSSANL